MEQQLHEYWVKQYLWNVKANSCLILLISFGKIVSVQMKFLTNFMFQNAAPNAVLTLLPKDFSTYLGCEFYLIPHRDAVWLGFVIPCR